LKPMKDLSLYIHIPFCKSRCAYCGFITFAEKDCMINNYIHSLIAEIRERAKDHKEYTIVSIYFGGGTPSHPSADIIVKILKTIKENFKVTKNAEITIESNPESLNEEKIIQYKEAGFNRLSIGIQSLNNKTLKCIGRTHNKTTAVKAIIAAKKHFKNYSLDFIIGLPYQNITNFTKQLNEIVLYNPSHLSFYFLSPDNDKIKSFIKDCPTEEQQIKIYELLTKRLKKEGYKHYEVSNYAKPGHQCRHNLRYWEQKEYLGLGLAAHSFINDTVHENEKSLNKYIKKPLARDSALHLDSELKKMDYVMMCLRTNRGINKSEFRKKFGNINQLLQNAEPYIESKKLINNSTNIRISQKGVLILDKIIDDLI